MVTEPPMHNFMTPGIYLSKFSDKRSVPPLIILKGRTLSFGCFIPKFPSFRFSSWTFGPPREYEKSNRFTPVRQFCCQFSRCLQYMDKSVKTFHIRVKIIKIFRPFLPDLQDSGIFQNLEMM